MSKVLRASHTLPEDAKLKLMFLQDGAVKTRARGRFEAMCQGVHFTSELLDAPRPLYDYIMYAERRTLSPQPQLMIELEPEEYKQWRQVLTFR
eukprot:UN2480